MNILHEHFSVFVSATRCTFKMFIHFFRIKVLANRSKLKTITIESSEFGDDGCVYLAAVLRGSLMLQPEDELLYYRLSKLLASLHEEYLWEYIDDRDALGELIDTADFSEKRMTTLNQDLQKLLRHFQGICDWKQIKNAVPIDKTVFRRHQKKLYCLQRLYLSNCNIGSVGVQNLAEALAENDSLRELVLDHNLIGDSGAKAIGKMLSQNVSLKEVDLSHNRIDKNGFCAIVVGWGLNQKYSVLENLDLTHNRTTLKMLKKDQTIPVDVVVSIQEIKERVKVASF